MKKNIGIVTLYDLRPNYGNRLQNLAVQTILEKKGYSPTTYLFERNIFGIKGIIKYFLWKYLGLCSSQGVKYQKSEFIRTIKFNIFNKTCIKTERIKKLEDVSLKDFYIVGSDQTWNANWYKNDEFKKNMYLLTFANPKSRIAFSPSFGVANIPDDLSHWFEEYLPQFNRLSVREESGADIIRKLTGREAIVLVDPTMLLSREEWRKFEKKPKNIKKGYVLTYFLSPMCTAAKEELNALNKDREVYELLTYDKTKSLTAGPSEFLWLFDHADLILTDSFHACVFSFLFDKPFIVYDRTDDVVCMNSRLETLMSKFHLERKYANSGLQNDIWEHDYEEGYKQLEIEREKAMNFLKEALEG